MKIGLLLTLNTAVVQNSLSYPGGIKEEKKDINNSKSVVRKITTKIRQGNKSGDEAQPRDVKTFY